MKIKEWIEAVSRGGEVCADYMRKVSAAGTREELFRVLCDANGGSWLMGLHARGVVLPVVGFMEEYANFVNGKRVVEYPQGYTSKFYCRYGGEVVADTTLVYMLECGGVRVTVPANRYPRLVLSRGSSAEVVLGDGARLDVEMYGDAGVSVSGDQTRVRITKH